MADLYEGLERYQRITQMVFVGVFQLVIGSCCAGKRDVRNAL